ncbi:hypothetical protein [Stenotrophomonas sp. SORGH_AS_0321]|uniref:hypothetical protein n=1 Tax=Stenotrophomonas sp. SORGH_AS_0321 TaxID=3041787 RepID=UPI002865520E|nr:hypothetical protein [Stenotrophomonas sp. SORGH_AS_0321]MDR6095292.1 hypothetical protein [Stenotrophomonas sp. SORGH_AS_0321]
MGVFSPPGTRLHALIGDAMLDLPVYLVERLEQTLDAQGRAVAMLALIAHLAGQHAVTEAPSATHPHAAAQESPDVR